MSSHDSPLQHHFCDLEQQYESSALGMWVFLVQEILFFGGFFLAYAIYRASYPMAFEIASRQLSIGMGAFNTVVLIGSSLTMVLAVHAARVGDQRRLLRNLWLTLGLGGVFLVVKAFEYTAKFQHHLVPGPHFQFPSYEGSGPEIFYSLYFGMTALHALHMIIGMGYLLFVIKDAKKGRFTPEWNTPVDMLGLYWHFVDIVWIFLFPLLYLIARH